MKNLTYLIFASAMTVVAQTSPAKTPTPVTPAPVNEVSQLEKAGLNQIAQEYQTVLQHLSQANIDVAKSHPGFHLDPQNPLSGKLVKDEPKGDKEKAEKPAEKPAEKK